MTHAQLKSATRKRQAELEAKKETGLLTPARRGACKSWSRSTIQISSPRNGLGISPTGALFCPGKSEFVLRTTAMCSTKASSMFRQLKSPISDVRSESRLKGGVRITPSQMTGSDVHRLRRQEAMHFAACAGV